MADKYTEQTAKALLVAHGIKFEGHSMTVKRCGIKLWGAIDYLCNTHKYSYYKETKDA